MAIQDLDAEQLAVYNWQYDRLGGFKSALWKAISVADMGNLGKLELAFPVEVGGFKKFAFKSGWWKEVEKLAAE